MTLLVALLMVPAILYLTFRYYYILQNNRWGKKFLSVIPGVLFLTFFTFPAAAVFHYYLSGDIDVLSYSPITKYWFWFGLIFSFQLLTWVLLADVLKFISRFVISKQQTVKKVHQWFVLTIFVGVFVFTGIKTYSDTTSISIREHEVRIRDLPKSLEGFRIVHITDIQGDEYTGRKKIARYIKKVNEQDPDLVIFTGDLISYGTDFIEMSAEELGKAQASYRIWSVVGDHDYWAGVKEVKRALMERDIPLLENENRFLQVASDNQLKLTGITEVYSEKSDSLTVDSLLMAGSTFKPKVLASHQVSERIVRQAKKYGYNLLLGGHTHGGQIQVPFLGMKFSASEWETKYNNGLYRENDLTINVDNGLGFTLAPVRYNAPPTVSVIILKSG